MTKKEIKEKHPENPLQMSTNCNVELFGLPMHPGAKPRHVTTLQNIERRYLNVTIICEYKILRFWGSNDFAGINFCDEVELNFAISRNQGICSTLKPTCLVNVAEPRLNLLQCSVRTLHACRFTWKMPNGAACTRCPVRTRFTFARETPTVDIIKRHFCKLVMARERSKER